MGGSKPWDTEGGREGESEDRYSGRGIGRKEVGTEEEGGE